MTFFLHSNKGTTDGPLLPLLFVLFFPLAAHAQQALTLHDAVSRARTMSPSAKVARADFAEAQWLYRGHRASLLPALILNGNAPGLQRSITDILQDDGSVRYIEQNQARAQLGLSINQTLPMTGGQVFVSSGMNRINSQFGEITQNEWRTTPLLIGFSQPLFQFNNARWTRRLEPIRFQIAQRTFAESLEGVAIEVVNRFFDVYVAAIDRDIAQTNVAVNDTIYTLSRGRYEIGTIAENELLQTELELLNAQTALSDAEIAYQQALRNLKITLDLPYDTDVTIAPPTDLPGLAIDADEAVAHALQRRAQALTFELQTLEAERDVTQSRRTNGFSATLNASYGLNQSAPTFEAAYTNPLDQQQFSIGFQMPLWQWGQGKAELEAALANYDRTAEEIALARKQLEQDVYFEALRLQQLQQQVAIAAKADTVAARRFEVAKNRYLIGRIDITQLFNAQREQDAARRSYLQGLRQFWTSYYEIRRLTLFDAATGQPIRWEEE